MGETDGGSGPHSLDGLTLAAPLLTEWGLELTDSGNVVDPEALLCELTKRMPSWRMIPQILSVYWPGDSEVEQFLYERRDTDKTPSAMFTTLHLINVGKFTSEAANALRMSRLENLYTDDIEGGPSGEVVLAVEGLALSRPVEALPLIVDAGLKNPWARSAVLIAVAGYDDVHLARHAEQISRMVLQGAGVMPTDEEAAAYGRLSRLLEAMAQ